MDEWHTRLARALAAKGWTVTELARQAGLEVDRLYKYTRGHVKQPRADVIERLAEALGVSALWLEKGLDPGEDGARENLWKLIDAAETSPEAVSKALGLEGARLESYLDLGVPRVLPRDLRQALGAHFAVAPSSFEPGHAIELALDDGALIRVLEIDLAASAERGEVVETGHRNGSWRIPRDWVAEQSSSATPNLRIVKIHGNAMPGVVDRGDTAIIDIADRVPDPSGVYILDEGLRWAPRRVAFVPYSDPPLVRVTSSHPDDTDYERRLSDTKIIGRLIARWQRL